MGAQPIVVDPIGGQAVIEGVMMRSNAGVSMAVRTPSGEIALRYVPMAPWRERYPALRWPLLRGVATLFESLGVGFRMLEDSAALALGEEPGQKSGCSSLSLLLGVVGAIALFAVLPAWVYAHLPKEIVSPLVRSAIEGIVRLALFVGYLGAIGMIPEVKRLFEYHGAEHQVIKCHEAGLPLEPANARQFSPLHPRCGTSFLLVTALVGIAVFSIIPRDLTILARVGCKIALLPLVAGLSYEVIRLAGKAGREGQGAGFAARVALVVTTPGLWLQKITTRPARDEMLEVAIASLQRALASTAEPAIP
ncbi:MAG: DUF1385 domain-containing protein [Cyanobacteria bacterium REEB65]|nr:DUF1385 domain-containing protein [Cyanobacteria bacterium REEB65]